MLKSSCNYSKNAKYGDIHKNPQKIEQSNNYTKGFQF